MIDMSRQTRDKPETNPRQTRDKLETNSRQTETNSRQTPRRHRHYPLFTVIFDSWQRTQVRQRAKDRVCLQFWHSFSEVPVLVVVGCCSCGLLRAVGSPSSRQFLGVEEIIQGRLGATERIDLRHSSRGGTHAERMSTALWLRTPRKNRLQ